MTNREAIDILNDVIRELYKESREKDRYDLGNLGDALDDVRQFLGRDL